MSDSQAVKGSQLSPLEEDQAMVTTGYSFKRWTFPPTSGFRSVAGCLGHRLAPLILQLLSFIILAGLLLAVINQGSKLLGSQSQSEQELYQELTQLKTAMGSKLLGSQNQSEQELYQELTQLKVALDRLCRPCPWDWTSFQENCYFFSKSQRNWKNSIKACLDMEAQLVVIETEEEQSFLQQTSKNRGQTWMGLSDLNEEATWKWVNGLPLLHSFHKYWNKGEPNNADEEDCAEFTGNGWNDAKCDNRNFWICKKSSSICSSSD
ncbi:CD209 antigen-like protein C [Perognathus longimembris pacificus]|uniref:CD209 antigen-like protein C n=1 Tax=Perognathus longimembris pacificus TaxID=214514 RepID=UPI002019B692|nr:CD209 antigen-like protein C [Perognathus longimembris pacificus]